MKEEFKNEKELTKLLDAYKVDIPTKKLAANGYNWVGNCISPSSLDVIPEQPTGKDYPDRQVAPVLKSSWSSDPAVNFRKLENELGFNNRGSYSIPSYPGVINVIGQSTTSSSEVAIRFLGWSDSALKYSERVPVVAKEVFKRNLLLMEGT